MNRCTVCLMPDTRPDTHFVDGVCSACLSYKKRASIDWIDRHDELLELLDRHNGRCIVPSSGGKDSTAQVMLLKALGADVTVVTATTCHLTRLGRHNIDNLARHARTIEVTPNRTTRATLNRLGLELVGDISWPEHVSIFTTPFRVAVDLGISLLFYGENPQEAYGGPPGGDMARIMTRRWVSEFGGFLGIRPSDMVGQQGITERDMQDYLPPSDRDIESLGVEAHFLGQYTQWDSHRNFALAREAGFRWSPPSPANWWVFENQDNAQTGLHDYMGFLKYGYGRGCAQISVDIRSGRIGREEALRWVKGHDGAFPESYAGVHISEMLDAIGMDRGALLPILDRFTNKALFRRVLDDVSAPPILIA